MQEKPTPKIPENAVQIGIMDDIDPQGTPNTACQQLVETASSQGKICYIDLEILPRVKQRKTFIIPDN